MSVIMNKQQSKKNVLLYFFLLSVYIVVNIITINPEGGGGIINQVSAGGLIVLCIVRIFSHKRIVVQNGKEIYYTGLVFLVYLLARLLLMFLTDYDTAKSSVRNEITILFWLVSLLFCIREFNQADYQTIEKRISIIIVLSFLFFFQAIFLKKGYLQSIDKISGVNAAGSAYMLVPLIMIALKGKVKIVGYILCLVACAFSQKRQALVGFTTISIFLIMDLIKDYFRVFRFIGVICVVLAIMFSGVIVNSVFSGIIERQQYLNEKDDITDSGRSEIWSIALDGYVEAPLVDQIFGGGPGAGARYVEERVNWFVMPHNGFIEVLCDYGIVGLIFYVFLFISLFRFPFRYPRSSLQRRLLLGVILAWIVANAISHAGNVWIAFLGITVGYMVNLDYIIENNDELL